MKVPVSKRVLSAITRHAISDYPRECCGLLVQVGRMVNYFPCENKARGTEHFVISPADYALAEDQGEIKGVVHSHPEALAEPSQSDLVSCEQTGMPWHILEVRKRDDGHIAPGEFKTFFPTGYHAPLVGRMFYHGVLDCYTIIKDFYLRELGIVIPDFVRNDDWWVDGQDLYMENFTKAGFEQIPFGESPRYGDVILMQIRSERANHGAVFLGEAALKEAPYLHRVPDAMLHHLHGRLSERAVYGGHYRDSTRAIVRHKDMA